MGHFKSLTIATALAGLLGATGFAGPAAAQESDPSLLALGVGWYDFNLGDDEAADFRIEYRHGQGFFDILKPFAGLEVTSDGSVWAGAGLALDFKLGNHVALTLSSGPGYYSEGDGKDLGSELEFRSQAELSYIFDDKARLGVAVSHLSNAGIGDRNPGTEVLSLYYMVPLHSLTGN
ncbi:acyloxyacyl hydrolase [Limibacillus sp. MBR-115]|jgi:hypothetical protein|uniref:acyloxyacyl hydrolase n=1 Tax=Limibacillus sp. MBR-115 TaxID=3156465 RepID=UPI003398679D